MLSVNGKYNREKDTAAEMGERGCDTGCSGPKKAVKVKHSVGEAEERRYFRLMDP